MQFRILCQCRTQATTVYSSFTTHTQRPHAKTENEERVHSWHTHTHRDHHIQKNRFDSVDSVQNTNLKCARACGSLYIIHVHVCSKKKWYTLPSTFRRLSNVSLVITTHLRHEWMGRVGMNGWISGILIANNPGKARMSWGEERQRRQPVVTFSDNCPDDTVAMSQFGMPTPHVASLNWFTNFYYCDWSNCPLCTHHNPSGLNSRNLAALLKREVYEAEDPSPSKRNKERERAQVTKWQWTTLD